MKRVDFYKNFYIAKERIDKIELYSDGSTCLCDYYILKAVSNDKKEIEDFIQGSQMEMDLICINFYDTIRECYIAAQHEDYLDSVQENTIGLAVHSDRYNQISSINELIENIEGNYLKDHEYDQLDMTVYVVKEKWNV